MKIATSVSIVALFCGTVLPAHATMQNSADIFASKAQESMKSRFSTLDKLAKSSQYTFPAYGTPPWCGFKGTPGTATSAAKPPAQYPNFETGKTVRNIAPTMTELEWLKGLKASTDQKQYVDGNLTTISYEYMSASLFDGSKSCTARALSNQKNAATSPQAPIEIDLGNKLDISANDCKNFPAYEADLIKDVNKYKDDHPLCPECFFVEGGALKDRSDKAKKIFSSCLTGFTQLFVDPPQF